MGNLLSSSSGTSVLTLIVSIIIIILLIVAFNSNMIEFNTMLGGIAFAVGFVLITRMLLSSGRNLSIALTSQDAVKFAINELDNILKTTPNAISDISRRSIRPIMGGNFN